MRSLANPLFAFILFVLGLITLPACGGGGDNTGLPGEDEGTIGAGEPCEFTADCQGCLASYPGHPERGFSSCNGNLFCAGYQNDNDQAVRQGVCGECNHTDDCDSGWCIDHFCGGECTLAYAQQEIEDCTDPNNIRENGSCDGFASECHNRGIGCPCCPSTGNLGCVYFLTDPTDDFGDPISDTSVQVSIDGGALINATLFGLAIDVPAGAQNYIAQKKGYADYSGTVEVQEGRTSYGVVHFDRPLYCTESCQVFCDCFERRKECLEACRAQCDCLQVCESYEYFGPSSCGYPPKQGPPTIDCAKLCGS